MFERFPYTNFHDLNLDWIIQAVQDMRKQVDAGEKTIEEVRKEIENLLDNVDEEIASKIEQAIEEAIDSDEFVDIMASVANKNIFYCVYPSMSQSYIQNAIDTHTAIKFTPGVYDVYIPEVNDCGYAIPSDRIIFFDNVTIRKVGAFDHDYDSLIRVDNVQNVKLFGSCTLDYNRNSMVSSQGEHGMCLSVGNSAFVFVSGLKCINAFGDGIYLNGNQYVNINNVYCYNNRRNAISIISGQHYRISDSYFLNSTGTSPEAGISIENNTADDITKDIIVKHCYSHGNSRAMGVDVYVTLKSNNADVTLIDIQCDIPPSVTCMGNKAKVTIRDSLFYMDTAANCFDVVCPADNVVRFINCEIDGAGLVSSGAFIRYTGSSLHNLYIEGCLVHDLTLNGRAVRALGSVEDVNNIIVDCKSFNLNIPAPTSLFRSTVDGANIIWSIENGDEKLFPADEAYPFNNYYLTAIT